MATARRQVRLRIIITLLLSVALWTAFTQQQAADTVRPSPAVADGAAPPSGPGRLDQTIAAPTSGEFTGVGAFFAAFLSPVTQSAASDDSGIAAGEALSGSVPSDATSGVPIYRDPGWPRTTAAITLAAHVSNPPVPGKWIDIDLTKETVTAYRGSVPLKTVLTSTGTPSHPTLTGTFRVWAKVPSQNMRGGSDLTHDRYNLPGVPHILYYYQGYALHGAYWHRNFGHPMSHGCANLTLADAAWLYAWTPLGTTVRVHQ